jgi:hypothetical protein
MWSKHRFVEVTLEWLGAVGFMFVYRLMERDQATAYTPVFLTHRRQVARARRQPGSACQGFQETSLFCAEVVCMCPLLLLA